jgi:hypothetical protein
MDQANYVRVYNGKGFTVAGNVGIGTANPRQKLEIYGNASTLTFAGGGTHQIVSSDSDLLSIYTLGVLGFNNGDYIIQNSPNDFDLSFFVGSPAASRMTIKSNGNVGIGMTDPSYQLQLSTNSAAKPTHNVWTIASDARIKTDISNFTDGLETVLKIRPTIYKYNGLGGVGFTDTESHIGVIAQEVELVAPYMVETGKGQIGGITVNDFKSYQGHALPFILVNAIKEQQGQIEELKLSLDNLGLINSTSTVANLSNAEDPLQWLTAGLQTLGMTLRDGIASLQEVIATKFTGDEANIKTVQTEQMTAREICVAGTDGETVCLTKDELKDLIEKAGSSMTRSKSYETPTTNATSTDSGQE